GGGSGTRRGWRRRRAWWSPSRGRFGQERGRDVDHFVRGQSHPVQVIVVAAVKIREVAALGALLADALDLGEHHRDQFRLGADARVAQRVLDDQRARVLSVDVGNVRAEVGGRDELIDRGRDDQAGGVDPRLVAENVEADARLSRLDRNAAHPLKVARQVAQLFVLEVWDLDAEEIAQLQKDLVHGRIAGALADAVDAGR